MRTNQPTHLVAVFAEEPHKSCSQGNKTADFPVMRPTQDSRMLLLHVSSNAAHNLIAVLSFRSCNSSNDCHATSVDNRPGTEAAVGELAKSDILR